MILNNKELMKMCSLIEANRANRKPRREGVNVLREEGTARLSEPLRISPPQSGPLTSSSTTSGPFSFPSQDGPSPAGHTEAPSTSQQTPAHPEPSNSILALILFSQDEHHSKLPTGSLGESPTATQPSTPPVQEEALDLSMLRRGSPSRPRFSTISSGPVAIEVTNAESSSGDNGSRIDPAVSVQMPAHEGRFLKWKSRLIERYYRECEEANRIESHQFQAP